MNVIDSDILERDAGGKPSHTFPHPALVPVSPGPSETAAPRQAVHHAAPFIAHLIAMAQQSPQTRVLRRIEPEIARAAYAPDGTNPPQPRRTLRTA
ncbi:MAG TPA: hypothetical protein VHC94_05275 [Nitrobacter sp.]|jgi:hypothetical protein|nr:hypothetical protein [Nitrobacter sp.]